MHNYKDNMPDKYKLLVKLKELSPESNQKYKQSDIGSGNLLADIYKDKARFCPERKRWFVYNGKVWRADSSNNAIMRLCKELADALYQYAPTIKDEESKRRYMDYVRKWQDFNYRKKIIQDAESVHPVAMDMFDKDIYVFNCQNGTLHLRTMNFKKHNPNDMLTKISGVEYNPEATCDRWLSFIDEVTSGDNEKAKYIQKILGYALSGDTKEECFFILYGATSRNGKGTLMEAFKKLMGDYGKATSPESIAKKDRTDGSKPNEDIARLQGARFVNISEPDKNMILSSALIKTLTGNDTIVASYKHEHQFEYQPQFKIFINTNHLPLVTDASVFSSGRVKVIPFEKHFSETERDKNLKSKLQSKSNLSGILNWCIDGFKKYLQDDGLAVPESVERATSEYKKESDKLFKFIEEEMEEHTNGEIKTSNAFIKYEAWCSKNGFHSSSIKTFSQELRQHGIEVKQKRTQGEKNPASMIIGWRLKDQFKEKELQAFIKV